MKKIIREIIPPIIIRKYRDLKKQNGFFGNYDTWKEAANETTGYDTQKILEKVRASIWKVKSGEAAYERDSILFNKVQYAWPVLSCLLYVATKNQDRLNVLDFGGSLGSSYYQNVKFLNHLLELRWNIVEQKKFVEVGRETFENDYLKFYSTYANNTKPRVFVQYYGCP
ncbi:MAG: methyltransferase, TIGR04325 family [Candidatus Vogelbacteria bacterium]|nr:methyltransferase, TIGR04325 family [Candidatus Vogelbacteria bacterium]